MPNIFDDLEASLFDDTTETFGFDASWLPSDSSAETPYTARVHFKDPNKKGDEWEMQRVDFNQVDPVMEYLYPAFPGLYESVRNTNGRSNETVVIDVSGQIQTYSVTNVIKYWDGRTLRAQLLATTG